LAALVVKQDILRRLNHLAGFVRSIKPDAFPSDRVQVGGDDELTLLARAVNRMLDDMARAQVLENRVRQVEKRQALGTLAAGISHDFNNMLYVIIGYVTMMKARISGDSVSNEYLDRIVKAVERASGLVRQLLSFGRRDEQGASRFSLAMIIRESVALFQASLPGSVEIRLKLAEAPDTILADSAQIYQMLMNLYINALQAIGQKGGLITITTTVHRADEIKALIPQGNDALKWLCLSVSDTGCGIPAEDLGRVFDPYFSTKPVGEGSGLGLSVVHQIAESAGGSVHVTSSVGAGSVFSAFLPLDQADSNPGDYHPSSDQVE
jgi:signal transduction histidine kinase